MSTVTFERLPAAGAPTVSHAAKRPGFWARFLARLIEAREKRALEEIRRHAFLLGHMDDPRWKVHERSEDSLPFVR
jgi:hypothetical protein